MLFSVFDRRLHFQCDAFTAPNIKGFNNNHNLHIELKYIRFYVSEEYKSLLKYK